MGWKMPGSLAIVSPRYGPDVLGGAETVVRQLSERLVDRGLPVEVFTTCAVDHQTWRNEYPEGPSDVNGVSVERFPIVHGDFGIQRSIGDKIGAGLEVSLADQESWLNEGFRSPLLYHALLDRQASFHTFLLSPYMFWTTYACSQIDPTRTVLRPCLHDEPFARLEIYHSIFRDARGIAFNSAAEAELATELFELPSDWAVLGEGVSIPEHYEPDRFRQKYGIVGDFALYTGRREHGKNVEALIEHVSRYRQTSERELQLVLGGRGKVVIPKRARAFVKDLGFLPEQDMHDGLAAATVVCQPSLWESFSRLLMDAWLAGTPVVVFGGCTVTSRHARDSQGGLVYHDDDEFSIAMNLLLSEPSLRAEMAEAGRRYVLDNFQWDTVMDGFVDALTSWAEQP